MVKLIIAQIKLIIILLIFIDFIEASSQILKINKFSEELIISPIDSILILSNKFIISGSEKIYIKSKKIENY